MNFRKIPPLAEIRPDDSKSIQSMKKIITVGYRYNLRPVQLLMMIVLPIIFTILLLFFENTVGDVLFYFILIGLILCISYGVIACLVLVYEFNRKYN
jgi:hypothetical protein